MTRRTLLYACRVLGLQNKEPLYMEHTPKTATGAKEAVLGSTRAKGPPPYLVDVLKTLTVFKI